MKKNFLSAAALVLALAALGASAFLFEKTLQYEKDLAAMNFLVEDLRGKVAALTAQADIQGLGDTTLNAVRRTDGRADVTFTFRPANSAVPRDVALKILSNGAVAAQEACRWDGEVYSTTVPMDAVNGCTYILVLDGTETVLASPANGAYPHLVNLADAMSAYCNLVLGDWIVLDNRLILDACHIQVQAPTLDAAQVSASQEARIMLKHNGDLLESLVVTLSPGEGSASFEGTLSDVSMPLPPLPQGGKVSLWLEAVLFDGQVISTCAATWTAIPDGWEIAVG